jgi:hypothetical protein
MDSRQLRLEYLEFAEDVLYDFFIELKASYAALDPEVLANPSIATQLNTDSYNFFCEHLKDFRTVFCEHVCPILPQEIHVNNTIIFRIIKKVRLIGILRRLKLYNLVRMIYNKVLYLYVKNRKKQKQRTFAGNHDNSRLEQLTKLYNGFDFIHSIIELSDKSIAKLCNKLIHTNQSEISEVFQNLKDFFEGSEIHRCLVISSAIPPTWSPTFSELKQRGWKIAYVIPYSIENSESYGCLSTNEITSGKVYAHRILGAMIFAAKMQNQPVLLNGESYHFVDFFSDRCVRMNLVLSCMITAIKKNRDNASKNLILLMYDGLKPVSKLCSELNQELSKYYSKLLHLPDKIIFNSNAEPFGDYLENTYGMNVPRLHFLRYSANVKDLLPRFGFGQSGDEFHIVTITGTFAGHLCTSRFQTHNMVRHILEQGMHFHSYAGESQEVIDRFLETVKPEYRRFLHIHPTNRNQEELVRELHQYHVGFNGSDHMQFSEGIATLKDRKYADGIFMYMQTTYATSFLVYAAAGLPILIPRFCNIAVDNFEKFSIPISLSEFANIKAYLKKSNLQQLCQDYTELQPKGQVTEYIDKFEEFITPEVNNLRGYSSIISKSEILALESD